MPEVLIGIGGFARSGKNTLADLLVNHFDFAHIAFADPMREIAAAIDPVVGLVSEDECVGCDPVVRYSDAVKWHGYDEAKTEYPEVRRFLQRLGTEAGRKILGENFWVDLAMKRIEHLDRVVISDMRFRNEAEAVRSAGGQTILVQRKGVEAANGHASEHDLADWKYDLYMQNNSAPADMLPRLEQFFARTNPRIMRSS